MTSTAHRRLGISVLLGLIAGALATLAGVPVGVLTGLAVISAVYNIWTMCVLLPMDADATREHAVREGLNPLLEEALLIGVALGTIAGIGVLTLQANDQDATKIAALGLVSVFLAWGMLHTSYVARYARAYYLSEPSGGLDFNQQAPPRFSDFYYIAFNIGMTYAVSDTDVTSSRIRALVARHCLLSYFFGTVILAATINLVAGIATSS